MSNELGAGFFGLTLLAILLGLAAVLILVLVGVVGFRRRTGTVPQLLKYVSIAVLGGVLLVSGFGMLAMYDEAVLLAVLFLTIVFVPLAAVGIYLHQTTELTRVDDLVTTGLAWSLPFVIGVGVTFGLTIGVSSTFDLAPAESQRLGVVWIAMLVGGAVIVIGSVLLASTSASRSPRLAPCDSCNNESRLARTRRVLVFDHLLRLIGNRLVDLLKGLLRVE